MDTVDFKRRMAKHPIIRHLAGSASHTLLLWSSLSPAWAASAPTALPTPDQFFRSSLESEGAERACNAAAVRLEPANLKEANADTQQALDWLKGWGARHFRFQGPAGCTDWAFVLTNWQITIGLPVTGVMSAVEVKSLLAERDRTATEYEAALGKANGSTEQRGQAMANKPKLTREPTQLDALPTAPGMPYEACVYGAQEAHNWARQQEVMQRRYLKSDLWQTGLPAHWASLISSSYPVLGEWLQAHGAANCSSRAALRYWLKVIGDPSNIEDPHSMAQSAEVLRLAQLKFTGLMAEYQQQKVADRQAYEAEVSRQGALEDSQVRKIDLADVSIGTRRSDLAKRLPPSRCEEDGEVTSCHPIADPCASPRAALDKAQSGWAPNRRDIEWAKENLDRCEFAYAKSAAGRSSALFAGQTYRKAVLRYENGILAEMIVEGLSDPEAVRRTLTRRHGVSQTSHEKRVFMRDDFRTEQRLNHMGQTEWVRVHEVTPVEATVFFYTWSGKGFVIELTENTLTMLKTGAR